MNHMLACCLFLNLIMCLGFITAQQYVKSKTCSRFYCCFKSIYIKNILALIFYLKIGQN